MHAHHHDINLLWGGYPIEPFQSPRTHPRNFCHLGKRVGFSFRAFVPMRLRHILVASRWDAIASHALSVVHVLLSFCERQTHRKTHLPKNIGASKNNQKKRQVWTVENFWWQRMSRVRNQVSEKVADLKITFASHQH